MISWKFKTSGAAQAVFYVIVGCSGGEERYLVYRTDAGTNAVDCRYLKHYLGTSLLASGWQTIERDAQADLARLCPGLTVTEIRGFAVRAQNLWLDDLRLGPAGDDAFQFASRLDGTKTDGEWQNPGNVASVYDTARRSQAIKITGGTWAIHGKDYRGLGSSYYDYNASGARTLSAWTKSTSGPAFVVTVETTAGLRGLRYQWTGTPTTTPYAWTGETPNVPLFGCQLVADGVWRRLERNLSADVAAAFPGETLIRARGMTFNAYTQDLYLDDVRLSNAMTVEHNTMGPGVIGHILRHTQTDPSTYAVAHRWFHYDQVGSVLSESDATGNLAQTHHQDAFGNTLASWQTGLVGGDRAGWHHNTKEWDGDVGLVYMAHRWYGPDTAVFFSGSPFQVFLESPYLFAQQRPSGLYDPLGLFPFGPLPIGSICGKIVAAPATAAGVVIGVAGSALGTVGAAPGLVGLPHTELPRISFGHNAIQFENNPLMPLGAMTLGNAINYNGSQDELYERYDGNGFIPVGDHEEVHTYQWQTLHIFFLPAWIAGGGPSAGNGLEHDADYGIYPGSGPEGYACPYRN